MAGVIWKVDLAWLAQQMRILPALTVCECSVGPLEISVAPGFVGLCDRLLLIEPVPYLAKEASRILQTKVLQVAVGLESGTAKMIDNGGSSYLKGTWAPTPADKNEFEVEVVTFDEIDDEQIDILSLDCEGQEWAVLSKMKSRPQLINIEIWEGNPYAKEIHGWLKYHEYVLRFATGPTAETQIYTKE
jgi:FkbM family methyltransferase